MSEGSKEIDVPDKQAWGWGVIDVSTNDYGISEIYKPVPNPAGKDFTGDMNPAI